MISLGNTAANAQHQFMSYNIRYDNPGDGEDRWELRKTEVCEMIRRHNPDFIGIQEALPRQVKFMGNELDEYDHVGYGRDGKGTDSESVPVFYRKKDFDLLEYEVFWLSETPQVPSRGWDAALNRIVTYCIFKDKETQEKIHVFNAHFDHKGEQARSNSARLLISNLGSRELLNEKVIVMGDLNSRPDEEPILVLKQVLSDAHEVAETEATGPAGTFNGFVVDSVDGGRIDYIFSLNLRVLKFKTLDDKRDNGRWPSDHLPVLAEVR